MKLNKYIDHTLLKPDAQQEQIEALIEEAKEYDFASVCVQPTWVNFAAEGLRDSDVKVCTVIGFPLGANTPAVKAFETQNAIQNGADEIDMVINIGALKSKNLTETEKVVACQIAKLAGADFVKTSTGFSTGGATVEDVALMRQVVGPDMGVKASGGTRSYEDAQAMIQAGANRIGTSSGVAIMKGEVAHGDY